MTPALKEAWAPGQIVQEFWSQSSRWKLVKRQWFWVAFSCQTMPCCSGIAYIHMSECCRWLWVSVLLVMAMAGDRGMRETGNELKSTQTWRRLLLATISKPCVSTAGVWLRLQLGSVSSHREECWCHLMRHQCHFSLCPVLPRGNIGFCVISDSLTVLNEPLIPSSPAKLHSGW